MNTARQIFEFFAGVYLFVFGLWFIWGAFVGNSPNRIARLVCFVCGLVFAVGAFMALRSG